MGRLTALRYNYFFFSPCSSLRSSLENSSFRGKLLRITGRWCFRGRRPCGEREEGAIYLTIWYFASCCSICRTASSRCILLYFPVSVMKVSRGYLGKRETRGGETPLGVISFCIGEIIILLTFSPSIPFWTGSSKRLTQDKTSSLFLTLFSSFPTPTPMDITSFLASVRYHVTHFFHFHFNLSFPHVLLFLFMCLIFPSHFIFL